MVTVIFSHSVQNFDAWKQHFDAGQAHRAAAGIKGHHVGRVAGSPETAVVITQWDTVEAFQKFSQDPTLRETMAAGGVIGAPTVQILDRTEVSAY
jgi:heme-degrading monooxygenase HmoA